MRLKMLVFY